MLVKKNIAFTHNCLFTCEAVVVWVCPTTATVLGAIRITGVVTSIVISRFAVYVTRSSVVVLVADESELHCNACCIIDTRYSDGVCPDTGG